jgi:hypothetical protein
MIRSISAPVQWTGWGRSPYAVGTPRLIAAKLSRRWWSGACLLGLADLLGDSVCFRLVQETTLPVIHLCSQKGLVVHDQHLLGVVAVTWLDTKARAEVAPGTSEDQVEARCGYLRRELSAHLRFPPEALPGEDRGLRRERAAAKAPHWERASRITSCHCGFTSLRGERQDAGPPSQLSLASPPPADPRQIS